MQFAISMPPFGPFADAADLADLAHTAEEVGWDGFFIWDHVVFDPSFHPIGSPWVLLAAVALRTSRLRIGTMITPLPRRRPWHLARETVAVDRLSQGRLVLGVGIGDPAQWEYGFFGEVVDVRARAAKLDEGLAVLAGLWSGEPFAFEGEHYQLERVRFRPTPWQQPRIPVWVGGWWPNRPPMRRAARWDGMFPIKADGTLTPEELGEAIGFVHQHRRTDQPFDVVISGATDGADQRGAADVIAPYAEVGATWWVEDVSPWRFGADFEAQWTSQDTAKMIERVRQGPPVRPRHVGPPAPPDP